MDQPLEPELQLMSLIDGISDRHAQKRESRADSVQGQRLLPRQIPPADSVTPLITLVADMDDLTTQSELGFEKLRLQNEQIAELGGLAGLQEHASR